MTSTPARYKFFDSISIPPAAAGDRVVLLGELPAKEAVLYGRVGVVSSFGRDGTPVIQLDGRRRLVVDTNRCARLVDTEGRLVPPPGATVAADVDDEAEGEPEVFEAVYVVAVYVKVDRTTGEVDEVHVDDEAPELKCITAPDSTVVEPGSDTFGEVLNILDTAEWPRWEFGW